jgi:hypothetical protein
MSQEVKLNIRIGDDELTAQLKEQLRLAEALKRTLETQPARATPPPLPPAAQAAPAQAAPAQGPQPYYDSAGRLRMPDGRFAPHGTPPPVGVTPPPNARPPEEPSQGPSFNARAIGAGVSAFMTQGTASGLFSQAATIAGKVPYLGALGESYLRIKSASLAAREAQAGQVAQLEQMEAALQGVIDTPSGNAAGISYTDTLKPLGFSPAEARQLATSAASAFGRRVDDFELSGDTIKQLGAAQRAGLAPQLLTSLAGIISESTGGRASIEATLKLTQMMRNLAEEGLDLRGSGAQSFLSSIAGYTAQLSARGLAPDQGRLGDTIRGIRDATGRRGLRPMQITQALGGMAGQAAGQIAAPFAGLTQAAIMAEAYRDAESPLDALKRAEEIIQDPAQVQEITRRFFGGGEVGGLALAAGSGGAISATEGARLAGAPSIRNRRRETARQESTAAALERGLRVSSAQAAASTEVTRTARQDTETLVKLAEITGQLQKSILQFTEGSSKLTDLAGTMATALDKISRTLP